MASIDPSLAFTALLEMMPGFRELPVQDSDPIVAALVQDWRTSTTPLTFWEFAKSWIYRHPARVMPRDRIIITAREQGWAVKSYQSGDTLDLTKAPGVHMTVEFSTRGTVTYASVGNRITRGKGRLAQVITWLTEG